MRTRSRSPDRGSRSEPPRTGLQPYAASAVTEPTDPKARRPHRARRIKILTLLEYLAEVLEAENNRAVLSQVRRLGAIADDGDLDDETCMLELLRAWEGWAKSPLHDAPLVRREDIDDRARAIALPEAALGEVDRLLEEYARLP